MVTKLLTIDVETCVDSVTVAGTASDTSELLSSTDGTTELEGPARFLKDEYLAGNVAHQKNRTRCDSVTLVDTIDISTNF